jgi:hypothetical protein
MLNDEIISSLGEGLNQVERPCEGLMVCPKAKKDQRRFRTSSPV